MKKETHPCPVCGKFIFDEEGSYEICGVCGWEDDFIQEKNPDLAGMANAMSLNEAREAWGKGLPIKKTHNRKRVAVLDEFESGLCSAAEENKKQP